MRTQVLVTAGLLFLLAGGCATQSVQQGKNLSASGIAYAEAVDKLLDITVERVIAFDTEVLKRSRVGSDPRTMIMEKNEAVLAVLAELDALRAQTRLLKAYFLDLQALADSPVQDDAGSAVQALSDSISKLNRAWGGPDGKEKLTSQQKEQIGALGGLVAHTLHGATIKRALVRDAEVVGIYLALQQEQLKTIKDMLKTRFEAGNDLFLNEKVIGPYVDRSRPLGEEWANNRKRWLQTQFVSQQLVAAETAAGQLRGIWGDILQGRSDVNSLRLLISDVNEFVTVVQALKDADQTK